MIFEDEVLSEFLQDEKKRREMKEIENPESCNPTLPDECDWKLQHKFQKRAAL